MDIITQREYGWRIWTLRRKFCKKLYFYRMWKYNKLKQDVPHPLDKGATVLLKIVKEQ